MLHPVGKLPASVYWRRRVLLLILLLALLGGLAWLVVTLLVGRSGTSTASSATTARPVPALERVVPPLEAVTTPTPAVVPTADAATVAAPTVPDPVAGGPCTDDMIALEVRTPRSTAVGSKPTLELLVSNVSAVSCIRALDKGLQEVQLIDLSGNRIWGSNDCFPEASSDPRTIAPGEVVSIPLVWGGLTSEPTCTAARTNPGPGNYVVRGRLDTKLSADAALTLT